MHVSPITHEMNWPPDQCNRFEQLSTRINVWPSNPQPEYHLCRFKPSGIRGGMNRPRTGRRHRSGRSVSKAFVSFWGTKQHKLHIVTSMWSVSEIKIEKNKCGRCPDILVNHFVEWCSEKEAFPPCWQATNAGQIMLSNSTRKYLGDEIICPYFDTPLPKLNTDLKCDLFIFQRFWRESMHVPDADSIQGSDGSAAHEKQMLSWALLVLHICIERVT